MQNTNNLNLKKPEATDVVDVDDFNDNADILDTEVTRLASTTQPGRMSAADKTKLNGIAAGANNYTHPANHPPSIISQNANSRFMTDAEKSKLAGIEADAQVNTVASVAGKTGPVTLAKGDVGLGSVENYPIATQAQAQTGTHTTSYMTPQRVAQAIATQAPAPADGSITDAKIGNRTINDTENPTSSAGTLTVLLSRLATRIRSITGRANWLSDPATTLEAAHTHHNATAAHNATNLITANRIVMRDSNGRARVAQPVHNEDIANKGYVDSSDAYVASTVDAVENWLSQHIHVDADPHSQYVRTSDTSTWQKHPLTSHVGASIHVLGNANDLTSSGEYMGVDLVNAPSAGWHHYKVFAHNPAWAVQVAIDFVGVQHIRVKEDNVWKAWTKILTQSDYDTLFTFANDGKTAVANAVTAKGVSAGPSDTFAVLADKVGQIRIRRRAGGDATPTNNVIEIRGLSFQPWFIIVHTRFYTSPSSGVHYWKRDQTSYAASLYNDLYFLRRESSGSQAILASEFGTFITVYNDGFRLSHPQLTTGVTWDCLRWDV